MNKVTCLVIDDNLEDRLIFEMAAEETGNNVLYYSLSHIGDILTVPNEVIEYVPDFIFIDLHMPKFNGIDCLKKLKAIDFYRPIPIIIYSTFISDRDILEASDSGAAHYFIKPDSINDLSSILILLFSGNSLPFLLSPAATNRL